MQGKIERCRLTTKNLFVAGDLEREIEAFIEHHNRHRYHESLDNPTPADLDFGRGQAILTQRERTKHKAIKRRRLLHRRAAA